MIKIAISNTCGCRLLGNTEDRLAILTFDTHPIIINYSKGAN